MYICDLIAIEYVASFVKKSYKGFHAQSKILPSRKTLVVHTKL